MIPTETPIVNITFGPPEGLTNERVQSVKGYVGTIPGGPLDGTQFTVICWQLEEHEVAALAQNGGKVYLSTLGAPPAHFLTPFFKASTYGTEESE